MYYRVLPTSKSFDSFWLIYKSDQDFLKGEIVFIHLQWQQEVGVIFGEVKESEIDFDLSSILEIDDRVEGINFSPHHVDMMTYIAEEYFCYIHHAAWLFFPKNLKEKICKQTLSKIKAGAYSYSSPNISLSEAQQNIYDAIMMEQEQKRHLLYGVTWSGKTQIYMKIIAENLQQEKQTLLLIPEIILTSQIASRISEVFGDSVIVLHSAVTAAKKSSYWMDIYSWEAKIIIGTRSSLFYPYKNLWAIIVDEEHDKSYVSDSVPRFHSSRIVEKMSELWDTPVIFASGTPRINNFFSALSGKKKLHQLLEKYEK